MKKVTTLLTIILFSTFAHAQQQKNADRHAPIYKLINSFMESIIKKDTSMQASLFMERVAWVNVQTNETFEDAKKTNPAISKINSGNYKDFIKYIGSQKAAFEEKFYNIRIREDGNLGTVSFDYSFWRDQQKKNWGQENWEVMFNGTEWKIAGVFWSINLEELSKEPLKK